MELSIPFKRYVINIAIGIVLMAIGGVTISTNINTWSDDWSKNWVQLVFFCIIMIVGYFISDEGMKEWRELEKIEKSYLNLKNKKVEAEINKLNLETKILEKQLKSKK